MESENNTDELVYIYLLPPITAIVGLGVITCIAIASRRLRTQEIESGRLVGVIPSVTVINTTRDTSKDKQSPNSLPPPSPHLKTKSNAKDTEMDINGSHSEGKKIL